MEWKLKNHHDHDDHDHHDHHHRDHHDRHHHCEEDDWDSPYTRAREVSDSCHTGMDHDTHGLCALTSCS